MERKVKLTADDLFHYNMYVTYTRIGGWVQLIFCAALIVYAVMSLCAQEVSRGLILIIIALMLGSNGPLTARSRCRRIAKNNPMYQDGVIYTFSDEGLGLKIGEESALYEWKSFTRVVCRKNIIYMFLNQSNALLLPKDGLMWWDGEVKAFLEQKLPKKKFS